ncbi:MAG TPA: hypothetical protein QF572_08130, partial [Vicinamibacterales bacterium]|nr:hypothetical protein [Vicinamibacterales bacterium]
LNSTSACRSFVMICSVLNRFLGILPPGRDARLLPLGLARSQGVRSFTGYHIYGSIKQLRTP